MESLHTAIADARARYVAANPRSQAADADAARYLPGGNTRTVLHFDPFPLTMVKGEDAELLDLDGSLEQRTLLGECLGLLEQLLRPSADGFFQFLSKKRIHQDRDGHLVYLPFSCDHILAAAKC